MNTHEHHRWSALRKCLAAVAFIAALVAAAQFLPLRRWGQSFTQWIEAIGAWGYVALFLAFALGAPLFAPGWLLSVVAGIAYGVLRGSVIALSGATTGAALGFLAGRHLFRERIAKWAATHDRFRIIDEAVTRKDWQTVVLLRLTPIVPFCIVNYFLALTQVRTGRYLLATFVGLFPGIVLHVYLGSIGRAALMNGEHAAAQYIYLGVGIFAATSFLIYLARFAKKRLHEIAKNQALRETKP